MKTERLVIDLISADHKREVKTYAFDVPVDLNWTNVDPYSDKVWPTALGEENLVIPTLSAWSLRYDLACVNDVAFYDLTEEEPYSICGYSFDEKLNLLLGL